MGAGGHTAWVLAQQEAPDLLLLRRAVDAVLVPHRFAPGQVGADDRRGQLTWCAAADELAERFPWLPPGQERAEGRGAGCADVVVDVVRSDDAWLVSDVRLEGDSLARLLADRWPVDAQRAASMVGSPVVDCLVLLPSLLAALLGGPRGRT